jgi:hypothetical protein
MRHVLTSHLRHERRHARLIPEMGVSHGDARIDLASVDESLDGFEIKSDHDDLRRLPTQAVAYGQVFDRLTLVTTERHLTAAQRAVPEWWGLATINCSRSSVDQLREANQNPECDPLSVARLLWRPELEVALATGPIRRRRTSSIAMRQELVQSMPTDELRALVRQCLIDRTSWRSVG